MKRRLRYAVLFFALGWASVLPFIDIPTTYGYFRLIRIAHDSHQVAFIYWHAHCDPRKFPNPPFDDLSLFIYIHNWR